MPAPAALAGVGDLGDWLNETIDEGSADAKRAALCLRLASSLVRDESGRTWVKEDGTLVDDIPDAVQLVTLYCAGRVYDNRDAQTSGGIDDASDAWKVEEAGAYLTASEKRMLSGFRGSGTVGGLSTVSTTRVSDAPAAAGRVPTPTDGVTFPWY